MPCNKPKARCKSSGGTEQAQAQEARAPREALDQLQEAKKAIDEKINELAQELGQPQQRIPTLSPTLRKPPRKRRNSERRLERVAGAGRLLQELAERQQDIAEALEQQAGEQPRASSLRIIPWPRRNRLPKTPPMNWLKIIWLRPSVK